jgi:hypothetical protein
MDEPHELFICYDGDLIKYQTLLRNIAPNSIIIPNPDKHNRFTLINTALKRAMGKLFMHIENDFYWVNSICLTAALHALKKWPEIDYIRFEQIPFTSNQFNRFEQIDGRDILWMKDGAPYRFTFNPHIRKFKSPSGDKFKDKGFIKQPEQHHNEGYAGTSCCMTGDNFRHLGIYDEGRHYKEYYADRFTGKRNTKQFDPWIEFTKLTDNPLYLNLFRRYLYDNGYKHSS